MSDTPTASTIRQYCDGELSAEATATLEAAVEGDGGLQRRVAFERALRERVASVMRSECPGAPAGLADRVRAQLARAPGTAERVEHGPRRSLAGLLRGPQRANVFAVAASLTLVLGAVLVGIFGTPIDDWRPGTVNLVAQAVPYVSGEHVRCADDPAVRDQKLQYRRPEQAGLELSAWLGARVAAVPLAEQLGARGWTFEGGGRCGVPVDDRSGHLIFAREDPDSEPALLSLFVVADRGNYSVSDGNDELPIRPGRWITVTEQGLGRPVRIYSDGELIYLLVAGHPEALEGAAVALEQAARR